MYKRSQNLMTLQPLLDTDGF